MNRLSSKFFWSAYLYLLTCDKGARLGSMPFGLFFYPYLCQNVVYRLKQCLCNCDAMALFLDDLPNSIKIKHAWIGERRNFRATSGYGPLKIMCKWYLWTWPCGGYLSSDDCMRGYCIFSINICGSSNVKHGVKTATIFFLAKSEIKHISKIFASTKMAALSVILFWFIVILTQVFCCTLQPDKGQTLLKPELIINPTRSVNNSLYLNPTHFKKNALIDKMQSSYKHNTYRTRTINFGKLGEPPNSVFNEWTISVYFRWTRPEPI